MIERYTRPEMARIWSEENKFKTWLAIEVYACEALAKLGKIPNKSLEVIRDKAGFQLERILEIEEVTHHDVIAFLTAVGEKVGPDSRYIHMGLTSSDILDTSNAIRLKQAGELLLSGIDDLSREIKEQAYRYKNTPMIGRSHGVHAEPITLGIKLATWYAEMNRNRERMEKAIDQISYGKISGAVGTFAHIDPSVEKYVCEKCGLKPAPVSTQIIQRDRYAEYMSTIAITGASLEKFALEIRHLSRTEVKEVEEFFGKGQKGSSAMPHKRNPIISERICGLARLLRGNALVALENVALWHERDISHSSAERVILADSTILLDYTLHKMVNLVKNLRVYPDRMAENLELTKGFIYSQRLLLTMVNKDIIREDAYKLVQKLAFDADQQKVPLKELALKSNNINQYLSEKEINDCFDIKNHLKHVDAIFNRVFQ